MSAIYIPDWGKPEICTDCPCFNEYTQCCQVDIMADIDNCPLIPVPDHGKLIDVRILENMHFTERVYDAESKLFVPFAEVASALFNAPTIIPADKEDT